MSGAIYNPEQPAGQVRLLIDDTTDVEDLQVFSDSEVGAFLTMNGDNVLRAAAQALLMIAGSEARLSKKITTQDLSTDGPAVAAELRAQAKQLRAQATEEDTVVADADSSYFGVAEYPYGYQPRHELAEGSWPW